MLTGACKLRFVVIEAPLAVLVPLPVKEMLAVMVALWLEETVPAAAVKLAVVALAVTLTDAGTLTVDVLDEMFTLAPPLGAAVESVTVQVLLPFDDNMLGTHWTDERLVGATSTMFVVCEMPLRVAVTVPLPLAPIEPALAVKLAATAFAGMLTEAGTVKAALFDESETVTAAGVVLDRVTVQELEVYETRLPGVH